MDYPKSVPGIGLVNGKFVDENPVSGTPGSLIPSSWGNAVTDEILSVIRSTNVVPTESNNAQLTDAIVSIADLRASQAISKSVVPATESVLGVAKVVTQAQANSGVDDTTIVTPKKMAGVVQSQALVAFTTGGTAPSFTLTPAPAITTLLAGQRFRASFNAAGTAGSNTLNVNGVGARGLTQFDANGTLVPANITNGLLTDVEYNGTSWVVLDPVAPKMSVVGTMRNAKQYVSAASSTATFTCDEVIVETALGGMAYQLVNVNNTANLAATGLNGMDTGSAPVSGFVARYIVFNPTTNVVGSLLVNATAAIAPSVYSGANMPSGFTASALVGVYLTDSTGKFKTQLQRDRRISFPYVGVLATTSSYASVTSLSISTYAPPNAVSIGGSMGFGGSTSCNMTVSSDVYQTCWKYNSGSQNSGSSSFDGLDLVTPQTIYFTATGATNYYFYMSSYSF